MEASKYVSLFWGGMLIGRFMGAVELSEMKTSEQTDSFCLAFPLSAFGHSRLSLRGWGPCVKNYLPLLVLCWLLFQFGKALAGRTLMIFVCRGRRIARDGDRFGGALAMWCVVGIGLFTSIGWPNIFSLALDGIGIYKSQVSRCWSWPSSAARCCRRCKDILPTSPGCRFHTSFR